MNWDSSWDRLSSCLLQWKMMPSRPSVDQWRSVRKCIPSLSHLNFAETNFLLNWSVAKVNNLDWKECCFPSDSASYTFFEILDVWWISTVKIPGVLTRWNWVWLDVPPVIGLLIFRPWLSWLATIRTAPWPPSEPLLGAVINGPFGFIHDGNQILSDQGHQILTILQRKGPRIT